MPATTTVSAYLKNLPEDRRVAMKRLRKVIKDSLPAGFKEVINYGIPSYVVPHSRYADGYHCDPKLPLPFLGIASTKGHVSVHHMGLYGDPKLMAWFKKAYAKQVAGKLDIGKSCIRFKNVDKIPYDLIGELVGKIAVDAWIKMYEKNLRS